MLALRMVLTQDGVLGLYRGFGTTIMREVCQTFLWQIVLESDLHSDTIHLITISFV